MDSNSRSASPEIPGRPAVPKGGEDYSAGKPLRKALPPRMAADLSIGRVHVIGGR